MATTVVERSEVLDRLDVSELIGLSVIVCHAALRHVEGGEEYIEVPMLKQLSATAAVARCLMPVRLRGCEVKAMRHIMDITAKDMAAKLGDRTAPESISRWEAEKQPMGGYVDKLIRLVVCEALKDRAPGIAYDASMIADLVVTDPRRDDPDYRMPPMAFTRVKVKENHHLVDAWNPKEDRCAA